MHQGRGTATRDTKEFLEVTTGDQVAIRASQADRPHREGQEAIGPGAASVNSSRKSTKRKSTPISRGDPDTPEVGNREQAKSEKDTIETRRRKQQRGDGPKNEPRPTGAGSHRVPKRHRQRPIARQEHVGTGRDGRRRRLVGDLGGTIPTDSGDVRRGRRRPRRLRQRPGVRVRAPRRATIRTRTQQLEGDRHQQ